MTFLTRDEIQKLFQDFEIEHFEEIEKDDRSGTGRVIHSHVFEVIARKKICQKSSLEGERILST